MDCYLVGLTKYNGKEFSSYSRKDSLAEDWVTTLYKDNKGNIWMGHWAGGVSMFNYKTQKFENLNLEEFTRFKTVTAIIQDEKNVFGFQPKVHEFLFMIRANKKMISINSKDGLSSDNVYDICIDQKRKHLDCN